MTAAAAPPRSPAPPVAGYAADVAALHRHRARHAAAADPDSSAGAAEALTLAHREIVLTGNLPGRFLELAAALARAVDRFPAEPDLRLLQASVAMALHRPDVARTALAAIGEVDTPPVQVLRADLTQFDGDYAAARAGYLAAAARDPQWDTTARLAALAVATGDVAGADELFAEAEDDLSVKQLRAFAWVRVQRGDLAGALGQHDRAAALLADAEAAYPGWWYVAARRAALAAQLGRWTEAVDGYRRVLAEVDRPEIREALGTALISAGAPAEGAACRAAALAEFRASADRGEVHYLHHLAESLADVDPAAAVAWAEADVALRPNGTTLSLLAECLHRAGRTAEALQTVRRAVELGAGDPVLIERARVISAAHG